MGIPVKAHPSVCLPVCRLEFSGLVLCIQVQLLWLRGQLLDQPPAARGSA